MRAVWLLFALVGCAYPKAMKQGAALVDRGEYRSALEQFDRALQARPRSDDALAARAATIDGAVAEALGEARSTLQGGAYEATLQHLAYVGSLRADHPDLVTLRTAVGDALVSETRASLDAGVWVEAYDRAARARDLVPERPEVGPFLDQLRAYFYSTADQATATGAWRQALGALDEVARHEPDRVPEVDVRRHDVRGRWASVVAADADAREQEALLGPALALRARAVEIAGRAEDHAAVERLRAVLRQQGQVALEVHWLGAPERTDRLVRTIQNDLARVEGVVWASGGVVADLRAPSESCGEGSTTWVAEQPYVAGQRQIPNPSWVALDQQLRDARVQIANLAPQEQAARSRADAARGHLAAMEHDLIGPLAARRDELLREEENAAAHVDGAARMVADLEAQLAQLQSSGGDAMVIAGLVMTLGGQQQRLIEEQNRLHLARTALQDLRARYEVANAQAQVHRDAVQFADAEHRRLAEPLGQWQQAAVSLEGQIAGTSPVLFEDIVETFRYDVRRWTLNCTAEATVTVHVPGLTSRSERLVDGHQTWDDAHPAWPAYGVAENPAWYPMSREALIQEIDGRLAPGLSAVVRRGVDDAYGMRVAAARQAFADGPDRGSAMLLGLLLAAPSSVDADTRSRLEAHLSQRYELEQPGSLTR